jgi:hypothetical protein
MRCLPFLLAWGLAAALSASPAVKLAHLSVFQPACSQVDPGDVQTAVAGASALLEAHCGISLSLTAWTKLPIDSPWCHLPAAPADRGVALRALAQAAKKAHPRDLALFLLPSDADPRISWALVDDSLRSACNSPQEARFLDRFGCFFFTDLSWAYAGSSAGPGPSRAALLVAHEVLHSLTQRGHPTGTAPGSVMADHVADLGPQISEDWCACAQQSPYLQPLPLTSPRAKP